MRSHQRLGPTGKYHLSRTAQHVAALVDDLGSRRTAAAQQVWLEQQQQEAASSSSSSSPELIGPQQDQQLLQTEAAQLATSGSGLVQSLAQQSGAASASCACLWAGCWLPCVHSCS